MRPNLATPPFVDLEINGIGGISGHLNAKSGAQVLRPTRRFLATGSPIGPGDIDVEYSEHASGQPQRSGAVSFDQIILGRFVMARKPKRENWDPTAKDYVAMALLVFAALAFYLVRN